MATRGAAIRRAVARLGARGPGRRYPAELRAQILEYVQRRRAAGATAQQVTLETGVPWKTMERWLAGDDRSIAGMAFERVEIVEGDAVESPMMPIVHGPAGISIEGLDVASLAELVRRLG